MVDFRPINLRSYYSDPKAGKANAMANASEEGTNKIPEDEKIEIASNSKKLQEESIQIDKLLKDHPKGHMIVIFKSSHRLYLAKDGKMVENQTVKKSDLDPDYGFLKGTINDEVEISFPVPIALGKKDRKGHAAWTPEGEFFVCEISSRKWAEYDSLMVSYPNLSYAKKALNNKRITQQQYDRIEKNLNAGKCPPFDTPLRGQILIHSFSKTAINNFSKEDYQFMLKTENPHTSWVTGEDWTLGCPAVEPSALFYMKKNVPKRTPIIIKP